MWEKDEEMSKMKNWDKLTPSRLKFLSPLSFITQTKRKKKGKPKKPQACMRHTLVHPLIFSLFSYLSLSSENPKTRNIPPIFFFFGHLHHLSPTNLSFSLIRIPCITTPSPSSPESHTTRQYDTPIYRPYRIHIKGQD